MRILCVGIMVTDILAAPVTQAALTSDSGTLETLKCVPGGDALNVATGLAALGCEASLIGRVGDDAFGRSLISAVADMGVNVEYVKADADCETATTLLLIDDKGERHILSYGDSFRHLIESDVPDEVLLENGLMHVGSGMTLDRLDGEGLARLMQRAHDKGCKTSMDITGVDERIKLEKIHDALYHTDIFMPSLREAELITGTDDIFGIKAFFAEYGLKTLAIKLGARGVFVTDYVDDVFLEPVEREHVMDTTGAGDSFVAGFLYAIAQGLDIGKAARLGSQTAAACIRHVGAGVGVQLESERLKEFIRTL